jgi:hypothetical protein
LTFWQPASTFKGSLQGAMMTPTAIEIGGLALIVGLFGYAQRLGGWKNRVLARWLNVAGAGLFVAWGFLFFPPWIGWICAALVWSGCLWYLIPWLRKKFDSTKSEVKTGDTADQHRSDQKITELNLEIFNLRSQLADARNELQRRDAVAARIDTQKREEASLLERAPKLWVEYKPEKRDTDDPSKWEALIFSKEGGGAIRTIRVRPLVWTVREARPITLHSVIGPVRAQPVECKFTAIEQIGTSPLSRSCQVASL